MDPGNRDETWKQLRVLVTHGLNDLYEHVQRAHPLSPQLFSALVRRILEDHLVSGFLARDVATTSTPLAPSPHQSTTRYTTPRSSEYDRELSVSTSTSIDYDAWTHIYNEYDNHAPTHCRDTQTSLSPGSQSFSESCSIQQVSHGDSDLSSWKTSGLRRDTSVCSESQRQSGTDSGPREQGHDDYNPSSYFHIIDPSTGSSDVPEVLEAATHSNQYQTEDLMADGQDDNLGPQTGSALLRCEPSRVLPPRIDDEVQSRTDGRNSNARSSMLKKRTSTGSSRTARAASGSIAPKFANWLDEWHTSYNESPIYSAVNEELQRILPGRNFDTLHKLFYAIGSRTAVLQLKEACAAQMRELPPLVQDDVDSLIDRLFYLDTVKSTSHIIRRFLMVRLTELRQAAAVETGCRCDTNCREAQTGFHNVIPHHMSQRMSLRNRQEAPDTNARLAAETGRPRCMAMDKLTEQHKQDLDYETRRKKVSDHVSRTRVWWALSKHFGIGVLALIPTGGVFELASSKIERTCDATSFLQFMEILSMHRGPVISAAAKAVEGIFECLLGQKKSSAWKFEEDGVMDNLKSENVDSDLLYLCQQRDC